jgi:hypothetical protein
VTNGDSSFRDGGIPPFHAWRAGGRPSRSLGERRRRSSAPDRDYGAVSRVARSSGR